MAIPKLPFRPRPFFDNKNAAFWNLQFAGWGGVFALRAVSAMANEQPWELLLVILVQVVTGFAIGYGVDSWFETKPIFMMILGVLGFVGGILKAYKLLTRLG